MIGLKSSKSSGITKQSAGKGKIKQIRVIDQAFEYNTDKTIRPEANIPSTLELRSNLTITDVEILNGGTNYTTAPDIAIVDSITGEKINCFKFFE